MTALGLVILAKLAGEHSLRGISQWVQWRAEGLAEMLGLADVQAPHYTTYSRILGHAVEVEELERVVSDFFAAIPGSGESVSIAVDGKTVRGTIPAGKSRGLHLLAAYLPDEGIVLAEVEVERQENEIPAAARLLRMLDLRGKVVTGDALLAQRGLSTQIVGAGGEYIWPIKGNQPDTYQDIQVLFEPEPRAKGFSPAKRAFRSAQTIGKGHGRIEQRRITVSSDLKGYLDWPHVEQVFKLERRVLRMRDGRETKQVTYGVTSLTAQEAGPKRLLELIRKHWAIENCLHYRRDDTLKEDRCCLSMGHAAHSMAVINNLILGLLLRRGVKNVPDARRRFAAFPQEALDLICRRP